MNVDFADHKYFPSDVCNLIGPYMKVLNPSSAKTYFKKIAKQCECYPDVLELYPYARCEYLEDFYELHRIICTGNETIINELYEMKAWYGWRAHIATALLILFHPNEKFIPLLEELKERAHEKNLWLINLAYCQIKDCVNEEDEASYKHVKLIKKTSESLKQLPYFIRANVRESQSKRIRLEQERLKKIYKSEGLTKATEYWKNTLNFYLQKDFMSLQKIDLSEPEKQLRVDG